MSDAAAHGYELKTQLEQIFGAAYPSPNIGQIYVTLQRLERDGLVRSQDVVQATRPNKRVYELTQAGHEALVPWMDRPSEGPRVRDDAARKSWCDGRRRAVTASGRRA